MHGRSLRHTDNCCTILKLLMPMLIIEAIQKAIITHHY
jgi:hypothetical protein